MRLQTREALGSRKEVDKIHKPRARSNRDPKIRDPIREFASRKSSWQLEDLRFRSRRSWVESADLHRRIEAGGNEEEKSRNKQTNKKKSSRRKKGSSTSSPPHWERSERGSHRVALRIIWTVRLANPVRRRRLSLNWARHSCQILHER